MDPKDVLGKELADQLETQAKFEADEKKLADEKKKKEEEAKSKIKIILKDTLLKEVDPSDYFFSTKGKGFAPAYFHEVCGYPVDREDLLAVFNKVFRPKDGMLFYRTKDKEVYIVIVPLKHSSTVGVTHNSVDGEFQKHALSFVTEGSVNLDTLRNKLIRVASTIKIVAE